MSYFTCDTAVIISQGLDDLRKTKGLLLSSVVLLELMASATDNSRRKVYEGVFLDFGRDNRLIVPNEADWLFASKILYWLSHHRRRVDGGRLRQLAPGISQ